MNSDPHDSTAWRSFGMLDADESAAFDDAARHDSQLKTATREMNRLQAALALVASRPVMPHDGHLERIQARLGQHPKRQYSLWFGVSGWASAAALALLLAWHTDIIRIFSAEAISPTVSASSAPQGAEMDRTAQLQPETNNTAHDNTAAYTPDITPDPGDSSLIIRRETAQLTREIAALHDQLQAYQLRDQKWFQAIPGVATPVIMVMNPPGTSTEESSLALNDSPVSHLLVETLRVSSAQKQQTADTATSRPTNDPLFQTADTADLDTTELPSAIPIYDAARDAGTLVVTNLPPAPTDREYNLWVQTTPEEKPIRLGILPEAGTSPSESFDFSLGTNTLMPSGFILTQDPKNAPTAPSAKNTVLQSPQVPET